MTTHKPVLLKESIDGLNLKKDFVVVDATLGGGGHSREILRIIQNEGTLIAIDQDERAIGCFLKNEEKNIFLVRGNFADIKNILQALSVDKVDAILADLGYSSIQLEDEKYGMSFLKDAPLDMRLDTRKDLSAWNIINEYPEKSLENIFREYGEEKLAKKIAHSIVLKREKEKIETTTELAKIVLDAYPAKIRFANKHPATKVFQALRIAVNEELQNLEKFIPDAVDMLEKGGRLAIITFHSLEDRIVKNEFIDMARDCVCPPEFPICQCSHRAKVKIITKNPIIPSVLEIENNPRARSAKLRIVEKI